MQEILSGLGIHISSSLFLGILLAAFLGSTISNILISRR